VKDETQIDFGEYENAELIFPEGENIKVEFDKEHESIDKQLENDIIGRGYTQKVEKLNSKNYVIDLTETTDMLAIQIQALNNILCDDKSRAEVYLYSQGKNIISIGYIDELNIADILYEIAYGIFGKGVKVYKNFDIETGECELLESRDISQIKLSI